MRSGSRGVPQFAAEELLHVAVAHQRDAMLITEAERVDGIGRRIVWVNPAFTELTGFTAEEAIGLTPDLTIGEGSSREAIANIQAGIEGKRPVRQEILKYRKDGTTFWAELDIAPVTEKNGSCRYFVCLMRDISEKKHAEELLAQHTAALAEASRLKSQFLANVSHELRTPLNAMVSYTGLLLEGVYGPVSETQGRALARLESNGRHLMGLINEVLDLSRIESGRMPVRKEPFALDELVGQLLSELHPLIARSGLKVAIALEPGLSEIVSDRQKLKQILLNLLSNALKFTREGWVRIEAAKRPRGLSITVADSGIGIAAEHQQSVFEQFWQVDGSPTRAQGGTGLGLSICRRLANLLGGEIELKSAIGEGAAFTVTLPEEGP